MLYTKHEMLSRCPTDNDMGGIDTVVGTKKVQTWHKSSNNGAY